MSQEKVVAKAVELNCKKVLIVERWNVGTCKMEFFEVKQDNLVGVPPIMYVHNVKFRRDFEEQINMRRTAKSIAIVTSSKRNLKIENAFARFFEIPIISHKEAINSKYDVIMQTSADISHGTSITFRRIPNFVEIGPRINVAQFVWK